MKPLTISSGVIDLLSGAIDSSKSLQKAIQTFLNNERTIRDLRSEVESLIRALESLRTLATDEVPVISKLRLPLLCYHQACQDFKAVIVECPRASAGEPQTSLRDWTQLRYIGGDVRDFKDLLAGYKSTFVIVVEKLNMQNATATREEMDQYKQMIGEATTDIGAHLKAIDRKLAVTASPFLQSLNQVTNESLKQLERERQSAQQRLLICENAASFLNTIQDSSPPSNSQPADSRAETEGTLNDARDKVVRMITELQKQLVGLTERSLANDTSNRPHQLEEDRLRLLKQIDMAKQCLQACDLAAGEVSRLRVHVLDNIVAEDNSHQVIVFPAGDLLHVKNVRAGNSSTQWLGSMTDATLQRISADRAASFADSPSPAEENDPSFGNKYGHGYKLQEREAPSVKVMNAGSSLQHR